MFIFELISRFQFTGERKLLTIMFTSVISIVHVDTVASQFQLLDENEDIRTHIVVDHFHLKL